MYCKANGLRQVKYKSPVSHMIPIYQMCTNLDKAAIFFHNWCVIFTMKECLLDVTKNINVWSPLLGGSMNHRSRKMIVAAHKNEKVFCLKAFLLDFSNFISLPLI